jgi:hypothetical protein
MTRGPRLSVAEATGHRTALGAAALAGWAGFLAWADWLAATLLYFFFEI